ncbi:MAG TPA: site-2 protease family protein [Candidatus Binataceae bacterium]|nr:site-2 protease family protein [Candidatus Binataceae bacterium]
MSESHANHVEPSGVLTEFPRYATSSVGAVERPRPGPVPPINRLLFFLTLLTTTMAGAYMAGADLAIVHPFRSIWQLTWGLTFSIPLMFILGSHEMGHFIVSWRNRVEATWPYFIPAPYPSVFFLGTFGAFIRMKSVVRSRRVMFDIGAAGPWAGALVAIPITFVGLMMSTVTPLDASQGGIQLGNSLIFLALTKAALHVDPDTVNINLHPTALAGWVGLFVTTLNLLPVGQLDGGHVTYALFGRRHGVISVLCVIGCILMVFVPFFTSLPFWWGWLVWAGLLLFLGLQHPSTADVDTPLDKPRRLAAWLTIALFVVTFSPVPLWFAEPTEPQPQQEKSYEVMHVLPHSAENTPHRIAIHFGA